MYHLEVAQLNQIEIWFCPNGSSVYYCNRNVPQEIMVFFTVKFLQVYTQISKCF